MGAVMVLEWLAVYLVLLGLEVMLVGRLDFYAPDNSGARLPIERKLKMVRMFRRFCMPVLAILVIYWALKGG